eukprot:10722198-Alexandrium_andersonii.AAC.1
MSGMWAETRHTSRLAAVERTGGMIKASQMVAMSNSHMLQRAAGKHMQYVLTCVKLDLRAKYDSA